MSKVIKTYQAFKETFNELFKKYHPDNKETGDAEMFMKYHQAYEELLNSDVVSKLIEEYVTITTTQAYKGCIVKCKKFSISIPPKFYPTRDTTYVRDKKGNFHKIMVKIIPDDSDEGLFVNKNDGLMIVKYIKVNIFDIICGIKKDLNILGEKVSIDIKPYEILTKKDFIIEHKGYPKRNNLKDRNPLTLQFKFVKIDLNDKDLSIINKMREKYDIN